MNKRRRYISIHESKGNLASPSAVIRAILCWYHEPISSKLKHEDHPFDYKIPIFLSFPSQLMEVNGESLGKAGTATVLGRRRGGRGGVERGDEGERGGEVSGGGIGRRVKREVE